MVVMIIAIIRYQNKQKQYDDRERELENEFVKASLEAREQTLEELSEQLHGNLQQTLSLAKINLTRGLDSTDTEAIITAKELVTNAIKEIKSLSKDLDPKYITGHSLEENIAKQLKRVTERTSLKTKFIESEEEIQLNNERHILVYRIVQEVINNCINYAEATLLSIQLESKKNHFRIQIIDDGKGCDIKEIQKTKKGLGIVSMQHRTKLMKGTFTIDSAFNQGTKISIHIPYHES